MLKSKIYADIVSLFLQNHPIVPKNSLQFPIVIYVLLNSIASTLYPALYGCHSSQEIVRLLFYHL